MLTFQIIAVILMTLILLGVLIRYKEKELSRRASFFWFIFWTIGILIVLNPELSTQLANFLGIGRGVDLAIYLAIALLFYFVFQSYLRFERLEKEITHLVREIAKINAKKQ